MNQIERYAVLLYLYVMSTTSIYSSLYNHEAYEVLDYFVKKEDIKFLQKETISFPFERDVLRLDLERIENFFLRIDSTQIFDYFSTDDFRLLRKQLRRNRKYQWEYDKLITKVELVNKKDRRNNYIYNQYIFSIPLFNKDKDKALVYSIVGNGSFLGVLYLLEKNNDSWDIILMYPYISGS